MSYQFWDGKYLGPLLSDVSSFVLIKDIPGFPGYRITSNGGVYSYRVNSTTKYSDLPKALKQHKSKQGYHRVALFNNKKSRYVSISRLLGETFLKKTDVDTCVRHLDDNNQNNSFSNLAWGTRLDNASDAIRNGRYLIESKHQHAKWTEQDILEIRKLRKEGATYGELMKKFNISKPNLSHICSGRSWSHVKDV